MPFICSAYNNFANKGISYESGKCKGIVLPEKSEADADGNCPVMAKLNVGKYSEAAFSVKISPAIPLVFGTRFWKKRGGKGNQQPAG